MVKSRKENQDMKAPVFPIRTKVHPTGFPPLSETLPQAIERIVSELRPEKIILFGSYAYGTPTPDSDVDLFVVMDTKAKQAERYRTVSTLLHPRRFPVDIIVKTPKEVDEAMQGGRDNGFFIREIIGKGKVLYDRNQRT
jgi:predicted nucleotidyltransferase